jgi:hypothetical protein
MPSERFPHRLVCLVRFYLLGSTTNSALETREDKAIRAAVVEQFKCPYHAEASRRVSCRLYAPKTTHDNFGWLVVTRKNFVFTRKYLAQNFGARYLFSLCTKQT